MPLPPLLLLLACVKSVVTPESGGRLDSGETGGADTAAHIPPCGPWAGVKRIGTLWTFAPTDEYIAKFDWDGTGSTTVSAVDGDVVTLTTAAHYAGPEGSFDLARTETWRCDAEGAWWTGSVAATRGESGGSTFESTGTRSFDPGWLIRPAELPVQDAWADKFAVTMVINDGAPQTSDAECTSTVAEEAVIHVEAGDRTARRVDVTCVGVTSDSLWLEEGVGMIENDDTELVAYAP